MREKAAGDPTVVSLASKCNKDCAKDEEKSTFCAGSG